MKKLLFLGILAAVLVVGDRAAKSLAETKLQERAAAAAGGGAVADATIRSFPFVPRLLLSGAAGDVDVAVTGVRGQTLPISRLELALRGVQLDKSRLLSDRAVELTGIDRGRITASVTAADLSGALGVPVAIAGGKVKVTVGGRTVEADVSASSEGSLQLGLGSLPALSVSLARTGLLSCAVSSAEVERDRVRLSCAVDEVPPALLRAAGRASAGG